MPGWTARTDNGVAMCPPFIENHHSSKKNPPDHSHRAAAQATRGVAVFSVDGTIYAMDDTCLHQRSSLGVGRTRSQDCHLSRAHGWRYEVTTGSMASPPDTEFGLLPGQSRRREDTGGRYVSAAISFGPGFGCIELNGGNCEPTLRPHH